MSKNKLTLALVLFVSVFGLFSCAKDKNKDKKTFSIGAPALGKDSTLIRGSVSMASTEISTTDSIVFSELKNHDFKNDPITLKTRSTCGKSETEDRYFEFRNVFEMRLQDVLPLRSLLALNAESKACVVEVVATNSHGSSHTVRVGPLEVHLSPAQHDLEYFNNHKASTDRYGDWVLAPLAVISFDAPMDRDQDLVHLVCEDFSAQVTERQFNILGFASLRDALADAGNQSYRKFLETKIQSRCRFMIETQGETHTTRITPVFTLAFKALPDDPFMNLTWGKMFH